MVLYSLGDSPIAISAIANVLFRSIPLRTAIEEPSCRGLLSPKKTPLITSGRSALRRGQVSRARIRRSGNLLDVLAKSDSLHASDALRELMGKLAGWREWIAHFLELELTAFDVWARLRSRPKRRGTRSDEVGRQLLQSVKDRL